MEKESLKLPQLLARAKAGDAEAFGEVCLALETRLMRHAMTLCGQEQLSEELAHDTLVEAWRCLRRYNGQCQFFTWLCAILINRYRNTFRGRHSYPEECRLEANHAAAPDLSPCETLELEELATAVRKCIQALPGKQQEVIYLRFYVDHSLDGIAAALGCSVGTVKSRLFSALEKLREMKAMRGEVVNLKSNAGIP